MRVERTGSSSVTDYHYNSSSAIKMSDHDRTWDDSDSIALPPTPGRTLNISTTTTSVSRRESSSSNNKAKRRLELEDSVRSECPPPAKINKSKHRPPPPQLDALKKKPLKPFTIPKKTNKRPEEPLKKEDQRPPAPKKIKTEQPTLPQIPKERPPVKWYKAEGEQQQVIKRIKTEEDLNVKKLKPAEEKVLAKRLKTQAWARILKKKQKLYIPHTSDPRQSEEAVKAKDGMAVDVKPIVDHCNNNDKENTSLVINVTATIMTTPIKMSDHNSIIKFMSMTPQLLSPLAENPRMVK